MTDTPTTSRHVILFSGGMDSVLAAYSNPEADLLFVGTDTKQSFLEKESAGGVAFRMGRRLYYRHTNMPAPVGSNAYVANRNLRFVLEAIDLARFLHRKTPTGTPLPRIVVVLGALKDDRVPDKTPEAFEAMGELLSLIGDDTVRVMSPFHHLTKGQMLAEILADKRRVEEVTALLRASVSCYKLTENAAFCGCGDCPSCFRKAVALLSEGISCVSWFEENPMRSTTAEGYRTRLEDGTLEAQGYELDRIRRMTAAFILAGSK